MFPSLQALCKQFGNLRVVLVPAGCLPANVLILTSDVSSPGIASFSEALVKVREGNSLVADVGALILSVVWYGLYGRSSCW
jgi:predicted ribosome-associated RNA-binding protein Tma20